MKKIFINIIYVALIIIFVISIFFIIKDYYFNNNTQTKIEELQKIMKNESDTNIAKTEVSPQIENFRKINEKNSNIVAWLEIEETEINFPVLQATNNNYYLTKDYNNKYNPNGSIFLDSNCNIQDQSQNIIIYGHNNNNELMFNNLLKYKDKQYYEQHPKIKITTNTEIATYTIIAVFESQVYNQNQQDIFKYYNYTNFKDDSEYYNYINNCKKLSIYEIESNINYREQLITLSTCEYSKENGRFVVLGIKEK